MEQIYVVFDGDEVIFKGTSKEIKEKFKLSRGFHAAHYSTKCFKIKGKYKIGLDVIDDHLEWQTRMLKLYGNTTTHGNPEKNLKELQDMGFDVELKYTDYPTNKGKWERHWRIECTKK